MNISSITKFGRAVHPAPAVLWEDVVYEEFSKFQSIHTRSTQIIDKIETAVLIAGFAGNALGLATLFFGRHMRTPSFVYHKALVFAYLVYCLNFLMVKLVNGTLTIPSEKRQLSYYDLATAFYAVTVNRVVSSVCGYMALYTSLAISIDRFLALVLYKTYPKFNRHFVAYIWICSSLVLSICLHSWAPWMENEIQAVANLVDKDKNQTLTVYRSIDSADRDRLRPYLMAKDWYNLIIRFAYAVLLTIFTSAVIYMFCKQQKRKIILCNIPKKRIRRERSLFYLMIAVVIMAYIQVVPREGKRVMELVYPKEYVAKKIEDQALSIITRRMYLLFGLYGFTFTTPILNLCTAIERSLIFYFYFSLNHSFRREVLTLLHMRQMWRNALVRLGSIRREASSFDTTGMESSVMDGRVRLNSNLPAVENSPAGTTPLLEVKQKSDVVSLGSSIILVGSPGSQGIGSMGRGSEGNMSSVHLGYDEKIYVRGSCDTSCSDYL